MVIMVLSLFWYLKVVFGMGISNFVLVMLNMCVKIMSMIFVLMSRVSVFVLF